MALDVKNDPFALVMTGLTDEIAISGLGLVTFGLIWGCGDIWVPSGNSVSTSWAACSGLSLTTTWIGSSGPVFGPC